MDIKRLEAHGYRGGFIVAVDGDTGYRGTLNVMRMVSELGRMGAAGVPEPLVDKMEGGRPRSFH